MALAGMGCLGNPTQPSFTDADLRVLYIGNSLTYTHDMPGLVEALAHADGRSVSQIVIAKANFSLEDHWQSGVAGEIRRLRPNVIVMQQGPSSLATSRAHLISWANQIAVVGREVGAEPALLMVWPEAAREFSFPDVAASYAAAAEAVSGRLIPAGGTWRKAWGLNSSLAFYGPDAFHPSYLGALAGALCTYAVLFDVEPVAIPELSDGVAGEVLEVLREAVAASLAEEWLSALVPTVERVAPRLALQH